ncbi:uncharacterized protein [Ptychodera flava]|uniref:uncharacterized protein n=1 Tax=Ptychodera flava TaxID=63121 RepID=UPI00396A9632
MLAIIMKHWGIHFIIFLLTIEQARSLIPARQKSLPVVPNEPGREDDDDAVLAKREIPSRLRNRRDMCGQTLTAATGTITSPNYPDDYDNNEDCTVTVQAAVGSIIEIVIDDLFIDFNGYTTDGDPEHPAGIRCYKDYLELQDVGVASTRYCGKFDYRKWTSFGNQVEVHFHSDGDTVRDGFSLTYNILPKPSDEIMFNFGITEGDNEVSTLDDGSEYVDFPSKYFGVHYNGLWINTNGLLSFNAPEPSYSSMPFPLPYVGNPVIGPYWADVDLRSGGKILYRVTADTALLAEISDVISDVFDDSFEASSALVITWYDVAFFATSWIGQSVRNTFQVVLITDSSGCGYVIFNFHEILWTTSADTELGNDIDPHTGLSDSGYEAQFGFDAGDAMRAFSHPDSQTIQIRHVDDGSNIDVPGRWLAKVCEPEINYCSFGNGNCEQICTIDAEGLPICSCEEGYDSIGNDCISIDACAVNNGGCEQVCINIGQAQRICDCTQGYELNEDGTTCDTDTGTILRICRKYTLHSEPLTWHDAKARCDDRNMAIADIQTSTANMALVNLLGSSVDGVSNFWFGVNRIQGEGWMTAQGNDVCYQNWASPEEANAINGENCAQFWSENESKWTSEHCDDTKGFICQY